MRFGRGRRFVVAGVVGCALVVLGAAGASAAKPHSFGDAEATLTITVTGTGTGVVVSTPQGISCSTVCSAKFPVNTDVHLSAGAVTGSTFVGGSWSGPCGSETHGGIGGNTCEFVITSDAAEQATFNTTPPPCMAPGVTYTNLAMARKIITSHNCEVGKITYAFSKKKKGRVLAQNPNAHWHLLNGAIELVVSKGQR